ncbi:MAG: DUF1835 domain-containing protein [Ginsengibacter sp.]
MHIVFQPEDVKILSKSFELDESLKKEIIEIKDDYSVGPLGDIYSEEGRAERKDWWRKVLSNGSLKDADETGIPDDEKAVETIINHLNGDEAHHVWIWVAANKRDVCGYYWLMTQLDDFVGKVYVLHLNNLPFINDKGSIFYPENLHEILPKEFLKAKKLAREITTSEFELDPDEWAKICQSEKEIRLLDGAKKLSLHSITYYDKYLMEFITGNWQKATRVIHAFSNKSKYVAGDSFMLWRLRRLIENDEIEAQGVTQNLKDLEVKKRKESGDLEEELEK